MPRAPARRRRRRRPAEVRSPSAAGMPSAAAPTAAAAMMTIATSPTRRKPASQRTRATASRAASSAVPCVSSCRARATVCTAQQAAKMPDHREEGDEHALLEATPCAGDLLEHVLDRRGSRRRLVDDAAERGREQARRSRAPIAQPRSTARKVSRHTSAVGDDRAAEASVAPVPLGHEGAADVARRLQGDRGDRRARSATPSASSTGHERCRRRTAACSPPSRTARAR